MPSKLVQKIVFLAVSLLAIPSTVIADNLAEMNQAEINQELRWAATIDDAETINQLLDTGASVNAANKFGKTALMNAVESGSILATATLLSMGADVNIETVVGCTALTFAAENGEVEITALLLERGAKLEAQRPARNG
jgi:ankyrin repeat protein